MDLYDPKMVDSYESISQEWYNDKRYAAALRAFNNYKHALEMDPKHRGAQYVGEAYLLTNNLPKAQEHLAALNKICGT